MTPNYHSCNKTSLEKVLLNSDLYRSRLVEYIRQVHALAEHGTHALKLYLIRNRSLVPISEKHVEACLYLLNKGNDWKPRSAEKRALKADLLPHIEFYCQVADFQHIRLSHDQQAINYLTTSIVTNLNVNVQEHFLKMLLRYINLRMGN
jgi:hypothetical protein